MRCATLYAPRTEKRYVIKEGYMVSCWENAADLNEKQDALPPPVVFVTCFLGLLLVDKICRVVQEQILHLLTRVPRTLNYSFCYDLSHCSYGRWWGCAGVLTMTPFGPIDDCKLVWPRKSQNIWVRPLLPIKTSQYVISAHLESEWQAHSWVFRRYHRVWPVGGESACLEYSTAAYYCPIIFF